MFSLEQSKFFFSSFYRFWRPLPRSRAFLASFRGRSMCCKWSRGIKKSDRRELKAREEGHEAFDGGWTAESLKLKSDCQKRGKKNRTIELTFFPSPSSSFFSKRPLWFCLASTDSANHVSRHDLEEIRHAQQRHERGWMGRDSGRGGAVFGAGACASPPSIEASRAAVTAAARRPRFSLSQPLLSSKKKKKTQNSLLTSSRGLSPARARKQSRISSLARRLSV